MYSRWKVWSSISLAFLAGVFSSEFVTSTASRPADELPAQLIQRDASQPEATLAQLRPDLSPRWPQNQ